MFDDLELRIFTEPQQGATYDDLLAVARRAEQLGFGAFFRSDHYLAMGGALEAGGLPGPTDAWTTLAGLARDTSTIRLGTLVTSATFRLPGPLAITVAGVDQMSGGRVELGLGAGWYEHEHQAYAIPFPPLGERFDRLEEQLAVITGLWSTPVGERFSYDGAHYRSTDSPALPKPVQAGGVPIIIGGGGPKRTPGARRPVRRRVQHAVRADRAVRRAARAGRATPCAAIGRDPASITLLRPPSWPASAPTRPSTRAGRRRSAGTPDELRAQRRRRHARRGRRDAASAGTRPAPSASTCRCSTSSDLDHLDAGTICADRRCCESSRSSAAIRPKIADHGSEAWTERANDRRAQGGAGQGAPRARPCVTTSTRCAPTSRSGGASARPDSIKKRLAAIDDQLEDGRPARRAAAGPGAPRSHRRAGDDGQRRRPRAARGGVRQGRRQLQRAPGHLVPSWREVGVAAAVLKRAGIRRSA